MSADYKTEPRKNIDQEWEANRTKATKILDAIKYALTHPAEAAERELPADLENPESQSEVDAVNEFATHCYDKACELSGVFEAMMVGDQVQAKLNDIQDEVGETQSDMDRLRDAGHSLGDF